MQQIVVSRRMFLVKKTQCPQFDPWNDQLEWNSQSLYSRMFNFKVNCFHVVC